MADAETLYLSRPKVLRRYDITDMTLWRWEHDNQLCFPKSILIRDRNYFRITQLEQWERKQAAATASRKAAKKA